MKCLAVNTASTTLSLALVDSACGTLFSRASGETRDQGNLLLSFAKACLHEQGLRWGDVDLLAVVTGPGSFTGIRIGIAAMRGLALAARIPLVGISAFDMLKEISVQEHDYHVMALESWRDELYFAACDHAGKFIVEPVNLTPEDFIMQISGTPAQPEKCIVSGDARQKLAKLMPLARMVDTEPDAQDVARIAMKVKMRQQPEMQDEYLAQPFYLRGADVSVSKQQTRNVSIAK